MYCTWQDRTNIIRTRWLRGKIREGDYRIIVGRVNEDPAVVVIDVDGIEEDVDEGPTVVRIRAVHRGKRGEEEEDAVPVQKLSFRVLPGFDGQAEDRSRLLQLLEHGDGGTGEDPFRDRTVRVGNLPLCFLQLALHRAEGRGIGFLPLVFHDGVRDALHLRAGENVIQEEVDHKILQVVLPDGLLCAAGAALAGLAGVVIVGAVAPGAGIPDERLPTAAAVCFPGEKIIDGILLMVPGGFRLHALGALPGVRIDDDGHPVRDPVVPEEIDAGIALLLQDVMDLVDVEELSGFGALAGVVQQADDLRDGIAVDIKGIDLTDDSGLLFIDAVSFIPDPVVSVDGDAVIQTFCSVIRHAAADILREVPAVPFRDGLQHPFCKDAGCAGGDRLHHVNDGDAQAGQLALIDGAVFPTATEAIDFPAEDGIKGSGSGGGDHRLKFGPGGDVAETGAGMIRVLVDKGIPFTLRIGADVPQLLLDGYVPLARGGITSIGDSGARRTRRFICFHN